MKGTHRGHRHSGREEEGQFEYKGSKGYSRAHQVVPEAPLSAGAEMGTQRSASLSGGLGGHAEGFTGGVGGVEGSHVVSVLREDNTETVCGHKEFTEVGEGTSCCKLPQGVAVQSEQSEAEASMRGETAR